MEPVSSRRSYASVRAALAKVIHLHNDFPAVLRESEDGYCSTKPIAGFRNNVGDKSDENASVSEKESTAVGIFKQSKNKTSNGQESCKNTIKDVSRISKTVILEQIEAEAESHGIEVSIAARSLILSQVKLLAQMIQDGHNYISDLEGLVSTTAFFLKRNILTRTDIAEQLLKEPAFLNLPLTSLWRFSCIGVVPLEQIIKCFHSKHSKIHVVDNLAQLILYEKNDSASVSTVSAFLGTLISVAYDKTLKAKYATLSKYAHEVLSLLTARVLSHVLENKNDSEQCTGTNKETLTERTEKTQEKKQVRIDDEGSRSCDEESQTKVMNIYELVLNNLRVNSDSMEGYCSAQLLQVLTHEPDLQLGRVLKDQERWRSTKANTTLSALMKKLVVGLGHEVTLNKLDMVVTNDEVNWGCVLTLVATALNCHRATVSSLKGMIEQNIRQGCENQEIDLLIIGFLFARHASQEGRHIFPSYSQWFSALFATESGSPAANKQSFIFLVRFLTDLVPHEPAYCLQAHLRSHIFVPKGCQEFLQDYCYLARARLQELKDSLEPGLLENQSSDVKNKVVEEVETAVRGFSETGKIPNFVLEASIFRKPHFHSAFLPALLAPRPLPDVPDSRAKLIGALHSSGKIPSSMYNRYIEACQKEASDLLTGVFIEVQEDIVIEEPITELSSILQELVNQFVHGQNEEKEASSVFLPILSRISQKIEEMMKVSDSRLKDVKCLTLDVRAMNSKLVSFQVIEKFIETLEKLCFVSNSEEGKEKERPEWLSQFLSLLTASVTLQQALFIHLIHSLRIGQHGDLAERLVDLSGVLLCEVWKIEGLFLPVTEASTPDQKPVTFTRFYLDKLELNTRQTSVFACRIMSSWLKWHLVSEGKVGEEKESLLSSLPAQLLDLYQCLAPRLALVCPGENEMTVADVYSCLEGINVPECSRLYFRSIFKNNHKLKVCLEKWISFELRATWEDTSIDVRQAYLSTRVLQDFMGERSEEHTGDYCKHNEIVTRMIFTFLKVGLKQKNSNEILLLIQSLAQHNLDSGVSLLKEWHKYHTDEAVDSISISSFMSICRCLPPSYFMGAEHLLQLAGILKNFIDQLLVASQDVLLHLSDTVYLCSSLLSAAARPGIKNIQVEQCLVHLRPAIVFHWESLSTFFNLYSAVVRRHSCLEALVNTLKMNNQQTISSLSLEESGIRLLALCLQPSVGEDKLSSLISVARGSEFLKWLLAYIGLQQIKGFVPLFPDDKTRLMNLKDADRKIILLCQEEFSKILAISDSSTLTNEIFPRLNESRLSLRLIPSACVLVLLHWILVEPVGVQSNIKGNRERIILNQFDLLLLCHNFLSNKYDFQSSSDEESSQKEEYPKNYTTRSSGSPDLKYLVILNKKLLCQLSEMSPKILVKLLKKSLSLCDSELRAAIKYKLQSDLN